MNVILSSSFFFFWKVGFVEYKPFIPVCVPLKKKKKNFRYTVKKQCKIQYICANYLIETYFVKLLETLSNCIFFSSIGNEEKRDLNRMNGNYFPLTLYGVGSGVAQEKGEGDKSTPLPYLYL